MLEIEPGLLKEQSLLKNAESSLRHQLFLFLNLVSLLNPIYIRIANDWLDVLEYLGSRYLLLFFDETVCRLRDTLKVFFCDVCPYLLCVCARSPILSVKCTRFLSSVPH